MNRDRRQAIMEIIMSQPVHNQSALVSALDKRGIETTQSSVSRDVARLGLVKVNGSYTAPRSEFISSGPLVSVETAGGNLVVVKTGIGQASPIALAIDRAAISGIVGTVGGDDTILIAVKNQSAQRAAVKHILRLFSGGETPASSPDGQHPQRKPPTRRRAWA